MYWTELYHKIGMIGSIIAGTILVLWFIINMFRK